MVYMAQDSDFKKIDGNWIYKGQEKEVEIPEYINGELVTDLSGMFDTELGGTKITKLVVKHDKLERFARFLPSRDDTTLPDISEVNTSNVKYAESMFNYSRELTSIDLSSLDLSNMLDMNLAFSACPKLETIDLSSLDTSTLINMELMFIESPKLQKIYARTKEDAERLREQAKKDGISPKFYIREPVEFDFDIRLGSYNIESIFLKDKNGKLNELKAYREKLVE